MTTEEKKDKQDHWASLSLDLNDVAEHSQAEPVSEEPVEGVDVTSEEIPATDTMELPSEPVVEEKPRRRRGRPRKNPLPEEGGEPAPKKRVSRKRSSESDSRMLPIEEMTATEATKESKLDFSIGEETVKVRGRRGRRPAVAVEKAEPNLVPDPWSALVSQVDVLGHTDASEPVEKTEPNPPSMFNPFPAAPVVADAKSAMDFFADSEEEPLEINWTRSPKTERLPEPVQEQPPVEISDEPVAERKVDSSSTEESRDGNRRGFSRDRNDRSDARRDNRRRRDDRGDRSDRLPVGTPELSDHADVSERSDVTEEPIRPSHGNGRGRQRDDRPRRDQGQRDQGQREQNQRDQNQRERDPDCRNQGSRDQEGRGQGQRNQEQRNQNQRGQEQRNQEQRRNEGRDFDRRDSSRNGVSTPVESQSNGREEDSFFKFPEESESNQWPGEEPISADRTEERSERPSRRDHSSRGRRDRDRGPRPSRPANSGREPGEDEAVVERAERPERPGFSWDDAILSVVRFNMDRHGNRKR